MCPGYVVDATSSNISADAVLAIATNGYYQPPSGSVYYCLTQSGSPLLVQNGFPAFPDWNSANVAAQSYQNGLGYTDGNNWGVSTQTAP